MVELTVFELARAIGGTVVGDGTRRVRSCSGLLEAQEQDVSLLHHAKYAKDLEKTRAGCVLMAPGAAANVRRGEGLPPLTVIEAANTYYAWQQTLVKLLGQRTHAAVGISPLAVIAGSAKIGKNASIHAYTVLQENVVVGDNVTIYPHVTLMHDARIGNDCVLFPGVTVYEGSIIGNRCIINAGSVVGSDGFAYAQADGIHHKVPQAGIAIIEDDVEVGVHSVIERAVLKATVVGRGSKIGGLVIVGHNCNIGIGNLIISHVGVSGSTNTGKYVVMAGQVGVNGHLDIPDFVKIGAQSGVLSNPEPNTEIVGTPAMEAGHAKRCYLQYVNLPELAKRVKALERQVAGGKGSLTQGSAAPGPKTQESSTAESPTREAGGE